MATKRRKTKTKARTVSRKKKSSGFNWGLIGLILVVALLIGMWQIFAKPESKAATNLTSAVWTPMVKDLKVDVDSIANKLNISWTEEAGVGNTIQGYSAYLSPRGSLFPQKIDLNMSQLSSNIVNGKIQRRLTLTDTSFIKAGSGTFKLNPVVLNATYSPTAKEIAAAGGMANVTLILNSSK